MEAIAAVSTYPTGMLSCESLFLSDQGHFAKVLWAHAFYRPQRSWGKVIFSEACVKNSVHRGVGGMGHGGGGVHACGQ